MCRRFTYKSGSGATSGPTKHLGSCGKYKAHLAGTQMSGSLISLGAGQMLLNPTAATARALSPAYDEVESRKLLAIMVMGMSCPFGLLSTAASRTLCTLSALSLS